MDYVRDEGEAKISGKGLWRRHKVTNDKSDAEIRAKLGEGTSVAQVAREHNVFRMTAMRIRDAAKP